MLYFYPLKTFNLKKLYNNITIKKFMMNLKVGKEIWSINIGHDWTHF